MKFRPLADRVLVRRTDEEQTTEGGIVLPGSAAEKPLLDFSDEWRAILEKPPLWTIALWNRPFERGDTKSAATENPPADSPNIVILDGSPPKFSIFSLTQCKALIWSSKPKLVLNSSSLSFIDGWAKKPNSPNL